MPQRRPTPQPLIAYYRISKDRTGEELGVDRQRHICAELADRLGREIVAEYVDNDLSAYQRRVKRPGFDAMLERLAEGRESLITYHVKRLYRRNTDLERIVDIVEVTGAEVLTARSGDIDLSTAVGRQMARIMASFGQGESEEIAERAADKHDELARKGLEPGGPPPYGFRRAIVPGERARWVHEPAEVEALQFMAERLLAGASLRGIAAELDARGTRTRHGRPWHSSTVRAAMLNPATAGLRVHRREVAGPGAWEPIFDRATWDQLGATIRDPQRRRRRRAPRPYLLSGLLFSAEGDKLIGRRYDLPNRSYNAYATRVPATVHLSVGADEIEAVVAEAVLRRLDEVAAPAPAAGDVDTSAIEAELAELARLRGEGVISLAEWMAAREPLQGRLDAALAAVRPSHRLAALLGRPGAARREWDGLGFLAQRELVHAVVERIVLGPAERGRWTTIDERLDPERGWGIAWRF